VDLLDPQATSVTLREYSIEVATSHLTVMPLDSMDDVHQYLRRKAVPTAPSTPYAADPSSHQRACTDSLSRRALSQLGPMHVMYWLQLITRPGEPDEQVSTLTFVELIGQESKVWPGFFWLRYDILNSSLRCLQPAVSACSFLPNSMLLSQQLGLNEVSCRCYGLHA
jgi:hypothetical protein